MALPHASSTASWHLSAESGFGLTTLRSASDLTIALLPTGAVYALRHGTTLINQVLAGPAEDGLFRLLLRERTAATEVTTAVRASASLAGAGLSFGTTATSACWRTRGGSDLGLSCTTTLVLHPRESAWMWRVEVSNASNSPRHFEVLLAQDLGLNEESAVRNNEAYTSHYIDLLPVHDDTWGWAILARQNQTAAQGHHPWLAVACLQGATAFCTDGTQFFGRDHRNTGSPAAARIPELPSKRLQYEFALAGLQSRTLTLAAGATGAVVFVARFSEHHPAASAISDLGVLRSVLPGFVLGAAPAPSATPVGAPLLANSLWLHGEEPIEADLASWFAPPHRHLERSAEGRIQSFFCDRSTHVVTRAKEADVARPHGHILRSGTAQWIDREQFGLTAYAAGIFSAQTYLGNPSLTRLLTVVRNALNVTRGSGQRAFVRRDGHWCQLGIPSAFALSPGDVRWYYRIGATTLVARAWCSAGLAAAYLEFRVAEGPALEFLVTHQLALGSSEFESSGLVTVHADESWAALSLDPQSFAGRRLVETHFALALAHPDPNVRFVGDEVLYSDGRRRGGPYLGIVSPPTLHLGLIQAGTNAGLQALSTLVAAARSEFATAAAPSLPPRFPVELHGDDPGVALIDEILPWFNHNAAIHFSAPHGLEQYSGAAWGVRDVCQGSLEWLLAGGQWPIAAQMLRTVFAQQYFAPNDPTLAGAWPQWFMFEPFRDIQQTHSHGDVCFWPVKALCDYVEATNDIELLAQRVHYTAPDTFADAGPEETLLAHCLRVIAHVESRFIAGTALVNYGDGDWDDTLQPADATLRTRLVSSWTVGLAYQTFGQLAEVCRRISAPDQAAKLQQIREQIRADFARHLMPDGIVAGFLVTGEASGNRPLLHPRDQVTGIRYRLLPMTRSILAELFSPEEARRHCELIEHELLYPDGVRLMSKPARYEGGLERIFRRAETAANVGREVGLQYVHAHLRYAEAMAKLGDADRLWAALQVVNPVGLLDLLPHATSRQSNVYFSSSDADFADRYEATAHWNELRTGRVPVRAGWRLYSSGPGLFLHKVRAGLLGLRESFGDIVFDPVLPRSLDGLVVRTILAGAPVEVTYAIGTASFGPKVVRLNGQPLPATREPNPYRRGGLRITGRDLADCLVPTSNRILVEL